MGIRSPFDANSSNSHIVDKMLGNAYPVVRAVYSKLDEISYLVQNTPSILESGNAVLNMASSLGYAPPVPYVGGIVLTQATQTVEYSGIVYAPNLAALPFTTTGVFEITKFRVLAGVVSTDLAAATGATLLGANAYQTQNDVNLERVSLKRFGAELSAGVVDSTAAIVAATAEGIEKGTPVIFEGAGTYLINAAQTTFPAGTRWITNGATFKVGTTDTSNSTLFVFGANTQIDALNVLVPTGIRKDRIAQFTGSNIQINAITAVSVDAQITAESNDGAIRFQTASTVEVGSLSTVNFDRAVNIIGCNGVNIRDLNITGYVRGIWISDTKHATVAGKITTGSVNAVYLPGHNAVLIDATSKNATENVILDRLYIEGSGEHGIRVGGAFTCREIKMLKPSVHNVGGCGIKLLGGGAGQYHEDIVIDGPIITDCGQLNFNTSGILLQFVLRCQIQSPNIYKRSKAFSCWHGINMGGVDTIQIDNPSISSTGNAGIWMDDGYGGPNDYISISRGRLAGTLITESCGIYVSTVAQTMRKLSIAGIQIDSFGTGVLIDANGTINRASINVELWSNTLAVNFYGAAANQIIVDIHGQSRGISPITCQNGSTWQSYDTFAFEVLKGGVWVAV